MALTEDDVARILKLVDEWQFDELRVEFADLKIHLRRSSGGWSVPAEPRIADISAVPAPADPAQAPEFGPVLAARSEVRVPEGCAAVRAPMLGTFYRAASPGAPPFVEIGDQVGPEDPVCLVEVMKLFNSVKAGTKGTVLDVLAADGELVEYGQPLVLIDPAR
ncbi:MAG: acetyl-CoA carboxylase biotin carboxyl carrier protein [Betaproteobacteria bacterium]|nr:acetyl-CoA carboxylase biotin carboxyl carrier protein [Betaproteobacteria bacterium]